jgi:hypothetical protein
MWLGTRWTNPLRAIVASQLSEGNIFITIYQKIMKKSLVMIVQMSDVLLEQPQKPIEKHQACNNNPVA